MSRRIIFPTGYQVALDEWATATFGWALITGDWIQDESVQVFLSQITADEFTDDDYVRQTMTGPTIDVVLPSGVAEPGYVRYHADPPEFGILDSGEVAESLVLFVDTGSDATSALVASYPCTYTANGVNPADFTESASGSLTAATYCGANVL